MAPAAPSDQNPSVENPSAFASFVWFGVATDQGEDCSGSGIGGGFPWEDFDRRICGACRASLAESIPL